MNGSNKVGVLNVCDTLRKEILEKKQEAFKKKDYVFDNGLVEEIVLAHFVCFELRNHFDHVVHYSCSGINWPKIA
jgi:hypothetical protein